MHPDLEAEKPGSYHLQQVIGGDEAAAYKRFKQGQVSNLQIRAVCSDCNSGWMSALENKVKDQLSRIVTGQPVELSQAEIYSINRWICLKAMVIDGFDLSSAVFNRRERQELKLGRLPSFIRIFAGTHSTDVKATVHCAQDSWVLGHVPRGKIERNVIAITLLFGSLYVHVHGIRDKRLSFDKLLPFTVGLLSRQFHPHPPDGIAFPQEPMASATFLSLLANILEIVKRRIPFVRHSRGGVGVTRP